MSESHDPRQYVQRITRFSLPVADLARATDFYEQALGFQILRRETRAETGAEAIVLTLGDEVIELVRFDQPGAPYPTPRTASDPWFQHLAIVVSDMTAAYAQVVDHGGATAISALGGPVLLPPSTGGVTAYKFRDPDGHPLELSFFPPGVGSATWQDRQRLFLGIDHTGIVVQDLPASLAFYCELLGFEAAPLLVNSGPTQTRLDGLIDPVVDIVAVSLRQGPHIELLKYRGDTRPHTAPAVRGDIQATEMIMTVADLAGLERRLGKAPHRDPDGRLIRFQHA